MLGAGSQGAAPKGAEGDRGRPLDNPARAINACARLDAAKVRRCRVACRGRHWQFGKID